MKTRISLVLLVWALAFFGCAKDAPPSVFDPNAGTAPQPVITSMAPLGGGLAGVTSITITGQNFSATAADNIVFFDAVPATILQASTTQLVVKAPTTIKDSIRVKVSVKDAVLFSAPVYYNLAAAAPEFGNFTAAQTPYGVECDTTGNVYFSVTESGNLTKGIVKITPAGVASDFSPAFSPAVANWRNMRFGWGGNLYCVAGRAIVFRVPSGGGASAIWANTGLTTLYDLDFDQLGNLWAAGPGTNVYRIKSDKTVKAYPFVATVRAVRVNGGYLYVGGKRDSLECIWRLPIDAAGDLGAEELYFNLSSLYGANSFGVQSLTFSADGDLYVGTDGPDGIVIVHPSKTTEPLYPGVIKPTAASLAWGPGPILFESRQSATLTQTLVRINAQKSGAPYYGRMLP